MSKTLVSAKVLGGGIAGASGVVGAGYGITKYFKSEETSSSLEESNQDSTPETRSEPVEKQLGDTIENPGNGVSVAEEGDVQGQPVVQPSTEGKTVSKGPSDSEVTQEGQTHGPQKSTPIASTEQENVGGVILNQV